MATTCSRPAKAILVRASFLVSISAWRTVRNASFVDEADLPPEFFEKPYFVDELRHLHGVLGGHPQVGQLFGLDGDVLALGVLVAFDDLGLLNGVGCGVRVALDGTRKHFLVLHALAAGAVDLVKMYVGLRLCRNEELDAEADQRDLDLTAPVRTGHRAHLMMCNEVRLQWDGSGLRLS
jgi:hypothetical protein